MKKLLVLSLVFACLTGEAANKADSVVMTVAGKQEMCIRDRHYANRPEVVRADSGDHRPSAYSDLSEPA